MLTVSIYLSALKAFRGSANQCNSLLTFRREGPMKWILDVFLFNCVVFKRSRVEAMGRAGWIIPKDIGGEKFYCLRVRVVQKNRCAGRNLIKKYARSEEFVLGT